jgi:NitT/TauT family transport system permease protein
MWRHRVSGMNGGNRKSARRWAGHAVGLLPLVCFLAAWEAASYSSPSSEFFFSRPTEVARTLFEGIRDYSLPMHTAVTTGEALAGFILGNLVGASVGISLWYSERLARLAKPYLVALGALPVFAIAPMTVLWFGIGTWAKITLAFLATVFIATGHAYKGAEEVDPLLLRRFRVFGASRWVIFRHLLLPSSAVWIIGSLRITIGTALLGAFVGEFIASERGLGHMIIRASGVYDTPRVLVGVLTLVALALVLDYGVNALERKIFRWKSGA